MKLQQNSILKLASPFRNTKTHSVNLKTMTYEKNQF
jgi:hypothetical protein